MSKREFPTSRTGGRNQPNSQPPKRRRANNDGPTGQINAGAGGTIEAITNVRQIRAIISDFSDVQSLQKGIGQSGLMNLDE